MEVASIERLPEGSDAAVRVYRCTACHHEMRLTVDGVRIEHYHVAVDNGRNFGIRVNRQVFRLVLLAPAGIDRDRLVGKPGLFEKQRLGFGAPLK
jgi:hypothetical protein